jgi:hypothetical protein
MRHIFIQHVLHLLIGHPELYEPVKVLPCPFAMRPVKVLG